MDKVIGVFGAGHMGGNMARCLLDAGYTVYIYDVVEAVRNQFAEAGAKPCGSMQEIADKCDIVITSLPNGKVLEAVLIEGGFLKMMKKGSIVIETSSTMPENIENCAAEAAKCGVEFVDCPVSGGPNEARKGKLILITAIKEELKPRCQDIFDVLGGKQFFVGDKPGSAKAVKIVNNTMSMGNLVVASEAFSLGVKYGLDPQSLFDILKVSGGTSNQFAKRFQKVVDDDYEAWATVEISYKDLSLAIDWAETKNIPMDVARLARSYYAKAIQENRGKEDMVSVYHEFL